MRKLIASINMTLDGFCDHTAMIADDEIHQHYNELLSNADTLIYGRITYQLMESYWPSIVKNPTGNKPMDEFAVLIDNISKIVFSRTLKNVDWKNTELKREVIKEEVLELKQQAGKNILVGSPGLIVALVQLDLIDEYQLSVQPTILGTGLPLFKNIRDRINLKLLKTKTFGCGATTLYYEPVINSKIVLRKTEISDLELFFIFQLDNEANYLAAFTSKDPADKTAYLQKYTKLLNDPTINMQTIIVENIIAGSVSKFEMEGQAEVTYWIDKKFWGKGVATKALKELLKNENARPIFGRVAFDNFGSQKVLEKCNFVKIGTDKGFANARQAETEEFIYKLT